jgi:hypothetical protein
MKMAVFRFVAPCSLLDVSEFLAAPIISLIVNDVDDGDNFYNSDDSHLISD